jgi:hypothetical protein
MHTCAGTVPYQFMICYVRLMERKPAMHRRKPLYVCIYVYVYVYMYACIHVRMYIGMYV